jgi:hypothetical protein
MEGRRMAEQLEMFVDLPPIAPPRLRVRRVRDARSDCHICGGPTTKDDGVWVHDHCLVARGLEIIEERKRGTMERRRKGKVTEKPPTKTAEKPTRTKRKGRVGYREIPMSVGVKREKHSPAR